MKASVLDLRRRMREILRALDQNQPVTILYRGKKKGVLYPATDAVRAVGRVSDHPAFGMWSDREDMEDVAAAVRKLRRVRSDAL